MLPNETKRMLCGEQVANEAASRVAFVIVNILPDLSDVVRLIF